MEINALPTYDMSDNPTGCCPEFHPENWDSQNLHFKDKAFVRATTRSIAHVPLNMGPVFRKTLGAIDAANAQGDTNFIVLSRDLSSWSAEHLFAVNKEVPEMEMVRLSGDFVTKVFEGPYKNISRWCGELQKSIESGGKSVRQTYFFYTTCPKCARFYGKNYVVGVAEVE